MAPSFAAPKARAALFWVLVALLLWVPIPLGSNRVWAASVLELAVFALLACWLLLWWTGAARASQPLRRARPVLALLALWLLLSAFSLVPMPAAWVAFLSPEAARMHSLAEVLGAPREVMTLSVDPRASWLALLRSCAYAGVFFLVLALVDTRGRVLALARCLVYSALVHSVYAVLMHLGEARQEWFGSVIPHAAQASGTYVNRNHFAGYLEMMLAVGIGLLIAGLSDRRAVSWKQLAAHAIDWILSAKMLLRVALCILVIALTTTHSRMGNSAFFASLLVAGVIGIALSRHATRNTVILLASLVVIDLLVVGSWFGMDRLAKRIEETTLVEVEEREEPAVHTLPMIRDYAVFGAGPGSFYAAFPRYRPEKITAFFDYAHNDYAQFAAESGLPGLGLLALVVLLSLAAALKAQWLRRDPLMRGMSFACIMGVTSILIHSWVDFNLQIPANAAYFMVLLALGWISLHHGRQQRPEGEEPGR
jgi:putative inorganic carbon (hco3(-)) transporter